MLDSTDSPAIVPAVGFEEVVLTILGEESHQQLIGSVEKCDINKERWDRQIENINKNEYQVKTQIWMKNSSS